MSGAGRCPAFLWCWYSAFLLPARGGACRDRGDRDRRCRTALLFAKIILRGGALENRCFAFSAPAFSRATENFPYPQKGALAPLPPQKRRFFICLAEGLADFEKNERKGGALVKISSVGQLTENGVYDILIIEEKGTTPLKINSENLL